MQGLDNRFFEEYKRLEQLCSEKYGSRSGVSGYIADMERRAGRGRAGIPSWTEDYRSLKHVRWVRNQLAHDSAPGQVSGAEDLAFVQDFRRRLLAGQDPLSQLERGRKERSPAPGGQGPGARDAARTPARKPAAGKRRLLPLLVALAALLLLAGFLLSPYGGAALAALRDRILRQPLSFAGAQLRPLRGLLAVWPKIG